MRDYVNHPAFGAVTAGEVEGLLVLLCIAAGVSIVLRAWRMFGAFALLIGATLPLHAVRAGWLVL